MRIAGALRKAEVTVKKKLKRRLTLIAALTVYALISLYPYDWTRPLVDNEAVKLPHSLRFNGPGIANTTEPPTWLASAQRSGQLKLSLSVKAADARQSGPARILTVSEDPYSYNLTVGQERDRLVVRLRTATFNAGAEFERQIAGVFTAGKWVEISMAVSGTRLRVLVDGTTRLDEVVPDASFAAFDRSYRLALGNEFTGNRSWRGEIRRAVIATPSRRVDYLEPGQLQLPIRLRNFAHPPEFVPWRSLRLGDALVNLFGFVPLGVILGAFLIGRRARPSWWAVLAIASFSLVLESLQWGLPTRYPSIDDLLLNTLGGATGLMLARRVLSHRKQRRKRNCNASLADRD